MLPENFESTAKYSVINPEIVIKICPPRYNFAVYLEIEHKEMQEIEFAVQDSNLYILNTTSARRSPMASVRTVVSMLQSGHLTEREAVAKLDTNQMSYFLTNQVDPTAQRASLNVVGKGFPAGFGVASGVVAFSPSTVDELLAEGKSVIYCLEGGI